MNVSNRNSLNLLDLPDEILLIIIKQLKMVDILYSLVNVTERLDQLVLNPSSICILDLTCIKMKIHSDDMYLIDDHVCERICQNVLSRINDQVTELIIDQSSIERVLHTIDYPQLHSLSLIHIDQTSFFDFLQGKFS
jgi:hypothetical protein